MEFGMLVEVAGEPVLQRKVAEINGDLQDFSGMWEKVAAWFYQMEAKQFASEGHGSWKALAPATVKARSHKGFGGKHPILEQTGKLVASLLGSDHHVRVETPLSIELGSNLKVGHWNLAMLHQRGTKHMPARPPIGRAMKDGAVTLYQEDITSLRAIFSQYIHAIVTQGTK